MFAMCRTLGRALCPLFFMKIVFVRQFRSCFIAIDNDLVQWSESYKKHKWKINQKDIGKGIY